MPSILLPVLKLVQAVTSRLRKTWRPRQAKSYRSWRFRIKLLSHKILHLDFEVSGVEIETIANHSGESESGFETPEFEKELPSPKSELIVPEIQSTTIIGPKVEHKHPEIEE